jgi:hypothetical protein
MLGLLFFLFLVLGACVEVILEVFRGFLERFGVTWAKSKISLDESLKLASEFAPDEKDLHTKLQAVKSAALQIEEQAGDKIQSLNTIKNNLASAGTPVNEIAAEINAIASAVKEDLNKNDRKRIFILRTIAAIIGCFLAWQSDFYVFRILAESPSAKEWLGMLKGLKSEWVNIIVGGLAAAAGSSYWHDQLDKVRSLKAVSAEMKKLGAKGL